MEENKCVAAESGQHSWVPLNLVVGGAYCAWSSRRSGELHVVEACEYCGMVSGSVTVEALSDYHANEAPGGLDPNSELASEIRARRLLSLRGALKKWCAEVRVPGPYAYPFSSALILLGLRAEDVEHVAEILGDKCKVEAFVVKEGGWAEGPSLVWQLGEVLDGLEGQSVYIAWVR